MGSFGSELKGSGHGKVDDYRSSYMNRLNREGCRRAGWMGAWQWMRDGEKFSSIKMRDACCSDGQKS